MGQPDPAWVDLSTSAGVNKDTMAARHAKLRRGQGSGPVVGRPLAIVIPPLRDRRQDIPLLVEHFIGKFNRQMERSIDDVSPEAMAILMEHQFPGNVRELENIVEFAFVKCQGPY